MKKGKMISVLFVFFFIIMNIVACFKNDTREITPVASTCSGTPGPLFNAVKALLASKCVRCHNTGLANGGKDFSIECNIVTSSARIKIRAVDEGSMPPTGTLPATDKTTIANWINAGAKYTD